MQPLRQYWRPLLIGVACLGALVGWARWPFRNAQTAFSVPVTRGPFTIVVTSTGELLAPKFTSIDGPTGSAAQGLGSKIASIVPEGTLVKPGDVVAQIDPAPVQERLTQVRLELQKAQADYTSAVLDSALALADAREAVRTAEYALRTKQLSRDEAQYEAPMIKQQAQIDYEIAARAVDGAKRNLTIKTQQAAAKLSAAGADLDQHRNDLAGLQQVLQGFTVHAPAAGMVIYNRDWDGSELGEGSEWRPWRPLVATLPDLTEMESDTYVNELDVKQVHVGQPVTITCDADRGEVLHGTVLAVANVGEQRPNQDAKVFKVKIHVLNPDSTLRPGLTTENRIQVVALPTVLSVPLVAVVNTQGFSYVYKPVGRTVVKQMIELGAANEDAVVVRRGLTAQDRVLLAVPADTTGIATVVIPHLTPKRAVP